MPSAWTALANVTLGSSASTVTFSSISGSYRDLVLVQNATSADGSTYTGMRLRFNSDAGTNYFYCALGAESTAFTFSGSAAQMPTGTMAPQQAVSITQIFDYAQTDKHKPVISRYGYASTTGDGVALWAERWASTSAITSIQLFPAANSFAAGSTFALYGVSA